MPGEQTPKGNQRFSRYFYNPVTYLGVVISLLVLLIELLLFAIDFFSPNQSVYLGIFTYILLPPFLIIGLILIPLGARWRQKQILKGLADSKPKIIQIDPTLASHQNAILIFIIGTVILLVMTAIGSYKAFHYTESVQFCGTTCHQIMNPEYQVHKDSPHARLKCVDCHIGSGAGWYVHYKMAGVRMMLKTFDGSYAKPVPAPVETLRPAKETCEQCHWPGKSFSAIQFKKTYYQGDPSQQSPWVLKMLMRVGADSSKEGGVHAHMFYNEEIYYVADDSKRQKISWIKTVNPEGKIKIFVTKDSPYKNVEPPSHKVRKMDCMDCHNRPTHRFEAPEVLVNQALANKLINPSIPMIKAKAVEALAKKYETTSQAVEKIRENLLGYYSNKHADYFKDHEPEIQQAIDKIIEMYKKNFFPEMKSRWDMYPDNIGHMLSSGCFRCHDEEHKTSSGETITRDCKACHIITQQGPSDAPEKNPDGLEFKHPYDGDESWKSTNCSDCHTGA